MSHHLLNKTIKSLQKKQSYIFDNSTIETTNLNLVFYYDLIENLIYTIYIPSKLKYLDKIRTYDDILTFISKKHSTNFLISMAGILKFYSNSHKSFEKMSEISYKLTYNINYLGQKFSACHEIFPKFNDNYFNGVFNKITLSEHLFEKFTVEGKLGNDNNNDLIKIIQDYFYEKLDSEIDITKSYILFSFLCNKSISEIAKSLDLSTNYTAELIKSMTDSNNYFNKNKK